MTLWRRTRNEVAGAWRSLRYDLGRREPDPAGPRHGPLGGHRARAAAFEDVTATGFSTFGGAGVTDGLRTAYGPGHARQPRRLVAVTAFGVLAVAGATGSYFAVVNGLGALLGQQGGTEPYPLSAAAPGGDADGLSHEGLGRGAARADEPAAEPGPGTIRVLPNPAATVPGAPATTAARAPQPHRTTVGGAVPVPTPTDCDCLTPPVPTPTAAPSSPYEPPAEPSPSPSTDDSPAPEPSDSGSPDPTATDDGGSGGGTERARHPRRH
ncbi:hypothetical protein Asp14428_25820 [Actinoplanes sp. NBRC 14428]|uniref:Uncharacterized protein n=1 Tax=Pseudosporangium ferrugineum TaxID=439699 RepID=A0A2T0S9N3_9ACTN|nr:hypothetical protein [Pseudosporangium ferrugineum]PRY30130.1 hypothetical protein CLV70_105300 [Pseudosporangium ferrugineum]BCJ51107.1 hypothetical protein Asp14428_25820 [Actinoplanes sp. NBRC 14428]